MAGFQVDQSSPFEFEPSPLANRGISLEGQSLFPYNAPGLLAELTHGENQTREMVFMGQG